MDKKENLVEVYINNNLERTILSDNKRYVAQSLIDMALIICPTVFLPEKMESK